MTASGTFDNALAVSGIPEYNSRGYKTTYVVSLGLPKLTLGL